MCSPKAQQIHAIKDQYKGFFEQAEKTLQVSNSYLDKLENHFLGNVPLGAKRICVGLFIQNNRLLASIITLCNEGFDLEALILVRSMLENTSYLLFIAEKDHEKRAELYQHSRALSTARHIRQLNLNVPDGEEEIDGTSFFEDEKKAFEWFRREFGQNLSNDDIKGKYALKPQNAADRLTKGCENKKVMHVNYRMFYPDLSALSHAELPGRYLYLENEKLFFNKWSRGSATKICLQHGTFYALRSLESVSKFFSLDIDGDLDSINDKLFSLVKNSLEQRGL